MSSNVKKNTQYNITIQYYNFVFVCYTFEHVQIIRINNNY